MPEWDELDERPIFCKRDYQKGYVKPPPDQQAFDEVPTWVEGKIGYQYGSTTRLHLAMLAGYLHYARRSTDEARLKYVGGEEVDAPENVFVVSILSIAENVHARFFRTAGRDGYETDDGFIHPGFKPFYDKAHSATKKLIEWGFLRKIEYVEGNPMKGTYWTFQDTPLEEYAAGGDCETVDVLPKAERVFLDLDAERFQLAEACTSKYQRGRYLPAENWNSVVAREGANGDRHVSIGSFQTEIVTDRTPTTIPYVVLEAESGDVIDRFEATRRILEGLDMDGVDLSRIIVSFSGNKSFHIRVPSGMFGSPVFKTVDLARRTVSRWASENVDEVLDTDLFDPRHLIRMIGSKHEKSGRYVTGFTGDEFMGLTIAEAIDRSKEHTPFRLTSPAKAAVCESLRLQLMDAADSLFRFYIPPWDEVDERPSGGAVSRALEGVEEGETWHENHIGRNKAAFIVACHLLKKGPATAWDRLVEWNQKNSPPLPERELSHCFRSAHRTIQKSAAAENV